MKAGIKSWIGLKSSCSSESKGKTTASVGACDVAAAAVVLFLLLVLIFFFFLPKARASLLVSVLVI